MCKFGTIGFSLLLSGFVNLGCGVSAQRFSPLTNKRPTSVTVSLSPNGATVRLGEAQQFTANVDGTSNSVVTWTATNGTITGPGIFTANVSLSDASLTAISLEDANKFATAQVVVNGAQTGSFDGPAELPRRSLATLLANTPAPGIVTMVPAEGDVQTSINAANCGDTIQLQAGATFTGNFTLPFKNCDDSHWIIIRSSAPDESLPLERKRITPCYAGVVSLPGRPAFKCNSVQKAMATLMALKSGGPITLAPGANHYRLGPALELTRPVGTGINHGLMTKDANQPANHIIIDRDWLHGTAQDETVRGVFLSGTTYMAVINSYFTDFHCTAGIGACVDSQAISGGSGRLPQGIWKIYNNFLEAAAENILFGGTLANSVTPHDITITSNHLFKPLTWMPRPMPHNFVGGADTSPSGCENFDPNGGGQCPFIAKNLFELKNAQRVLFQGNVLEDSWAGFTQRGSSILIEGANTSINAGYSSVSVVDVTIRYNRTSHTNSGFGITNPGDNGVPNLPVARISVHDDIFDDISDAYADGDPDPAQAIEQTYCGLCTPQHDVSINHITEIISKPKNIFLVAGGLAASPTQNWTFTNSIVSVNLGLVITGSGSSSSCGFTGNTNLSRIQACFNPYSFAGNLLIGGTGTWPEGNFFPANPAAVQFANFNGGNGGNYSLLPTSPYKNVSSDGKDVGADVDRVQSSTAGVE